jgi:glycosyltransferase involved in cell wall biosynthesis
MTPAVSILVPVYNVSKYIEKCAISLFEQTFQDVEYIFVNDATPDNSVEILQSVMERYPLQAINVRILHHSDNMGLAVARNTALSAAQGRYISVIDSDDYIDADMIELMYQKAIEEDADIVMSDIIFEYPDREVVIHEQVSDNPADYFPDMLINEKTHSFLCDKLIRKDLYTHPECTVPKGLNYFEDRYVMTRLCYFAKKISKVDKAFYHYVQYNSQAITKNKTAMHFENMSRFWKGLDEFLISKNEYDKYAKMLELPKVQSKISLFIDTHDSALRKQYRLLFFEEESRCLQHFHRGEKLMLLLVRYRMYWLAQLFHQLLVFKNRKYNAN